MAAGTTTTGYPTTTTSKLLFLSTQVRLLSHPLHPPSSLQTSLASPLSDKLVTDVLARTNDKIRTHNRAVFPAQAQRHVAEQIETLFWNEIVAERELDGSGTGNVTGVGQKQEQGRARNDIATAVRRDADLCASEAGVSRELPEGWEDIVEENEEEDGDGDPDGDNAARYEEMRAQLLDLCRRRDEAARKVQRYKQLQRLLEPYENAQERIQPNLVTKDGELVREMERMRALLARVTARMGEHQSGSVGAVAGVEDARKPGLSFDERLTVAMGAD